MALTRPGLLLLPALCVAGAASPASAEGERAISGGLGWATFSVPGVAEEPGMEPPTVSTLLGATAGATYEHAIGSDVSLRGELAFAMFHGGNADTQSALSYAGLGDVGAVFRFDVLKYVPYAFGGLGAVARTGGPIGSGADLVLAIGGGVDMLVDRASSYGLEVRLASFGGDVTIFTLGLRATRRWGYF